MKQSMVLVLAVAFSTAAWADLQDVKIGGVSILIRGNTAGALALTDPLKAAVLADLLGRAISVH